MKQKIINKLCEYGTLINSSDNPYKLQSYISNNIILALLIGFIIGFFFTDLIIWLL